MTTKKTATPDSGQLDKFKQAARELETDDDPKRFDERLGKLVKRRAAGGARSSGSDQ